MKIENEFDRRLAQQRGRMPESLHDALIEAVDTLDLTWTAVQTLFEDRARPEHAIQLLAAVLPLAAEKRHQALGEWNERRESSLKR